jgi:putative FmdB family regulatory protein
MPTYEYECTHCGHTFEALQKITDKPLNKCPKCHKKVKRLISSGVGIIFKGSGFYATDYRKKPETEAPKTPPNTCPKIKEGCNACKPK